MIIGGSRIAQREEFGVRSLADGEDGEIIDSVAAPVPGVGDEVPVEREQDTTFDDVIAGHDELLRVAAPALGEVRSTSSGSFTRGRPPAQTRRLQVGAIRQALPR